MPGKPGAPIGLSQKTIDAIDFDTTLHIPHELTVHERVGAVGPFSFGMIINALLPWLLKALEALIASGITAPTEGQVLAKAHELRAAAA